ncbi:MAG TPA: SRPBCC family protein [Candidatus Dormibacteraeota bacterium]|nr:SRPBCC family protein [Candidatus Dormibacteraeota bacterium]
MGHITVTRTIEAPVETVFAYVDDYRNTTKYMKDLTKWAPVGSQTHGKGAHFEVAMKAGPKVLDSSVLITHWTENKVIAWNSESGFRQTGKWAFRAKGGGTEATFDMEYEFGGGLAGKVLAKAAEPFVKMNIEASVDELKKQTEKLGTKKPAARK